MFVQLLAYFPAEISLIAFLVGIITTGKSPGRRFLISLFAIFSFFFASDAYVRYSGFDTNYVVFMDLVFRISGTLILPAMTGYFYRTIGRTISAKRVITILIPTFVTLVSCTLLLSLFGTSVAATFLKSFNADSLREIPILYGINYKSYYFWYIVLFDSLFIIQCLIMIVMSSIMIYSNGFKLEEFFNRVKSRTLSSFNAECVVAFLLMLLLGARVLVGRHYLQSNEVVSIVMDVIISVLLALFAILGYFKYGKHLMLARYNTDDKKEVPEILAIPSYIEANGLAVPEEQSESATKSDLFTRFDKYFNKGKAFLNPDLTIEQLCVDLATNRTYLSAMFNKEIGLSFRTYLNICRVDYAKSLMLAEPSTTYEQIAVRSGFHSASQFSKKFKEVTGMTPGQWAYQQGK